MFSREDMKKVENSTWFSTMINIPFWSSVVYGIYQLFCNYKITALIVAFWILMILIFWLVFRKDNPLHALRDFINIVDDPIDTIKESLHCMSLPFGYQLNISCLMSNRKTSWDIIRKQGYYENCDPEDKD